MNTRSQKNIWQWKGLEGRSWGKLQRTGREKGGHDGPEKRQREKIRENQEKILSRRPRGGRPMEQHVLTVAGATKKSAGRTGKRRVSP